MSKKYKIAVVTLIILLLVALNIWRWWASASINTVLMASPSEVIHPESFDVRALVVDSAVPFRRDIFHPKQPIAEPTRVLKTVPKSLLEPLEKSPDELAREAAQAEFSQIRCVGISVRENTIHAYLLTGGEATLVSAGDKIGNHFVVDKIMTDRVILRDPTSGIGGQIDLSGK